MDFSGNTRCRNAVRCCLTATALAVGAARASAQTAAPATSFRREQQPIQVEPKNVRFSNYLHDLNSPGALIGVVGGGVLEHLRQKPTPANGEAGGLGQVILSRAGAHAVNVSVRHSLAALMQRSTDDHYQFCECHGLVPRVGHALVETFTDRRADGRRALSFPDSPELTPETLLKRPGIQAVTILGMSRLERRCRLGSRPCSTWVES